MTNEYGKKKNRKKRPVTQTLAILIIVLGVIVCGVVFGSLFFLRQQQLSGEASAPAAKIKELAAGDKAAGSTVTPETADQSPQATTGSTITEKEPAENAVQTNKTDEKDPGDKEQPAHDPGIVTYKGKQYKYNDHLSNYLLLGVDTEGDMQVERESISAGQSDAMYLVSYDRKEDSVRILSIPRDTMTEIQLYNIAGEYLGHTVDHITLQYAYGDGKHKSCKLACEAVEHLLYEVPILGYAALNTDSIPLLADVVDGVPLTIPDNSLVDKYPEFTRGAEVVITTETAEDFLRYRDTHQHQQALVRMDRQKVFINAFAEKLKVLQKEDPHTVTDVYETLKPYMVTNMGNDVFLDLATAKRESRIETIPGKGVNTELYDEYHVDEDALYELILEMFYKEVETEE